MEKQRNLIIGSVVALIAVIFVVLNTSPVAINFGFFKVRLPLIVVLVVMVIIGMIIAWFFGRDTKEKRITRSLSSIKKRRK
nr:lipopolysaccharide assembly protein LapA domain-containing protein [Lactobacillus crispatus]